MVTDKLTQRVAAIAAAKKPAETTTEAKPADTTPPAGGTGVRTPLANEEYEAARKLPNTEGAIAGMIKVGLKNLPGEAKK